MPPTESPVTVKTENGEAGTAPPASASPDKPPRKRRLGVDPSLILSTEGRSKRRRTPSPALEPKQEQDPKEAERAKTLGLVLYNKIVSMRDAGGESMAEPFIKLPNKRQFPDYYETIKHPMSLEIIHQKLNNDEYHSLLEVCNDFYQMWNNAKRYNVKESTLFQWARKMHKISRTFYSSHTSGHADSDSEEEAPPPPPRQQLPVVTPAPPARTATSLSAAPSPSTAGPSTPAGDAVLPKPSGPGTGKKRGSYMKDGPTVYKLIKPAMRDIKAAKSTDGRDRDIATIFLTLPDPKTFPDYYRAIKNPVCLDDIEQRMMARRYHSSDEFFVEVERMCDNAQLYNEDGSEVWHDAQQIRGIVMHHRQQVKERLSQASSMKNNWKVDMKTPSKPVTPVRHGSGQSTHVGPIPGLGLPQGMSHGVGMHVAPDVRGAYTAQHTAYVPGYTQQSQLAQPAAPASVYTPAAPSLPQLPHGVVTEEVVSTLDRYPSYEQQAWISSLPPLALSIYRQMASANDARKRGVPPPAIEQRQAQPAPDPGPLSPTIKAIDFAYTDAAPSSSGTTSPGVANHHHPTSSIRLHNMRGVVTHAVAIASATSELELTAWVGDSDTKADFSLRVNGSTAAEPKLLPGKNNKPSGMRWTVSVPPARLEFKLEVLATRPGGAETSAIFINRQF